MREWPSLFLRQPSCCAPPTRQLTLSPAVTCACPREPPLRNRPRARGVNCDRYQSRTRDGKGIFIPHIAVLQREEEYNSSKFATLSDRQSRHFGNRGRNRLPYRSEAEKNLDSTSLARLAPDGPQSVPNGETICTGLPKGHRSRDGSAARPLVDTGVQPYIPDGSAHAVAAVSFFDRLNHEKTVGCRLYGPLPVWRRPRRIP